MVLIKYRFIFLFFGLINFCFGKSLNLNQKIHEAYLEHLIKAGVDSVRNTQFLNPLFNDSILYIAAKHHANYLLQSKNLSHDELDVQYKTPQNRAQFFGASDKYLVGENILYVHYLVGKEEDKISTYEDLAKKAVELWVKSPKHYKNMLEPNYQVCGLAIAVDEKEQRVYVVQKFAYILDKFVFKENKTLFKYSEIQDTKIVTDFEVNSSVSSYKLPYKLNVLQSNHPKYNLWNNQFYNINTPFYTKAIGNYTYLMCDYNATEFANFFEDNNDGIAIEQVGNVTYNCNNPSYFLKPSRRNQQSALNDYLNEPIYKKEIMKGFKPKRKNLKQRYKEVKKDNTENNFFQNIYQAYKLPYEPTSFKLKVAKINKDIPGTSSFNIVFFKENKIVNILHLTNYCGEFYSEFYPLDYLKDFKLVADYPLNPTQISYDFNFYFEKGKSDYRLKDLKPMLDSLSNNSAFFILETQINSFSSVEGNEEINLSLQKNRANNLLKALQENQKETFKSNIQTNVNWSLFYKQIDSIPELYFIKSLSEKQLKDSLINNINFIQKIEPYLKKQRYAKITINTVYDLTGENLGVFLEKEAIRIFNLLDESKIDDVYYKIADTLLMIQKFTYLRVKEGRLNKEWLHRVSYTGKRNLHAIYNNLFCFYEEFDLKKSIDYQKLKSYSDKNFYDYGAYNFYLGILKNWGNNIEPKGISMDELVKATQKFKTNDTVIYKHLPQLALNLAFRYVQYYHQKEKIKEMLDALDYLLAYYQENLPDENTAIRIIKAFIHYKSGVHARALLSNYIENTQHPELLKYAALMGYYNNIEYNNNDFGNYLINIYPKLQPNLWCDMFLGECGIDFQVFDHKELRDFYCQRCGPYDSWKR